MSDRREKKKVLLYVYIMLFIILFLDYAYNIFGIVQKNWFADWQLDSESLVIHSIESAKENEIGFHYGLLGGVSDAYPQQIGLQGIIFRFLNLGFLRGEVPLRLFHGLVVFGLCVSIYIFLHWVEHEFGISTAIIGYIGFLINRWMIVSARNLYWVTFTFFMPFLGSLLLLWRDERKKVKLWVFGVVAFITIFIRAACGFEMISSVMISLEIPIFYYAYKHRTGIEGLKRFTVCAGGAISAFLVAITINFIQQAGYFGSIQAALNNILYTVKKRISVFGISAVEINDRIKMSLEAKKWDVLKEYFLQGEPLVGELHMSSLIWVLSVTTALCFINDRYSPRIGEKRKKFLALSFATWISLLGPMSWYVLASPHSYIHPHINYILWSFPCIPLGCILCGGVVSCILKDYHNVIKKWSLGLILTTSIVFLYFYRDSCKLGTKYVNLVQKSGKCINDTEYVDIYFYENSLYYLISEGHEDKKIFFHLYPNESGINHETGHSFINRDFYFENYELQTPIWNKTKIARIPIPADYGIPHIRTGQFDETGREWEIYFNLENYIDVPTEIIPDSLTDQNWTNGIMNDGSTILMGLENALSVYMLEDKKLRTESGKEIKIKRVIKSGDWIHVVLSEPIDVSEGYPHKLQIISVSD